MKSILIINDCKYAQHKPSLPVLKFVKGVTYPLEDYLADSVIENGDGGDVTVGPDNGDGTEVTVEPETKEKPRKTKSRGAKKE